MTEERKFADHRLSWSDRYADHECRDSRFTASLHFVDVLYLYS
jgi:hypothetical protein